ncbi:hypothetical protein GCM10022403_089150 [Streptomyces coacervatus]|uniref:Uncharacterized protein n=1 Tax=Streptomyces coacervatus TaxID=647381 RepID=A0ABP7JG91_9ACTN|nr:hypothetical protein [Streptomyces coacervatus]MDF2271239.1 hypothetical protein [Streptomyces coacervatus]
MTMPSYDAYGHGDREDDPAAQRRAAQLAELGEELVAGQTWRQKEIAGRIYQELKSGAHVDDIKPLISQLRRTTIEDARDRGTDRRGRR